MVNLYREKLTKFIPYFSRWRPKATLELNLSWLNMMLVLCWFQKGTTFQVPRDEIKNHRAQLLQWKPAAGEIFYGPCHNRTEIINEIVINEIVNEIEMQERRNPAAGEIFYTEIEMHEWRKPAAGQDFWQPLSQSHRNTLWNRERNRNAGVKKARHRREFLTASFIIAQKYFMKSWTK